MLSIAGRLRDVVSWGVGNGEVIIQDLSIVR